MTLWADLVEDLAQALALIVAESLRDPDGGGVRHEDGEATRERHLLRQSGSLGTDRVLGHLADDQLASLEHILDAGGLRDAAFDVIGVEVDVATVEDGVLGDADVDEGCLHARQDVLDSAEVEVPVDLGGLVGLPDDIVLDERATLEHRDVRGRPLDVNAHQVATDGAALALATATAAPAL